MKELIKLVNSNDITLLIFYLIFFACTTGRDLMRLESSPVEAWQYGNSNTTSPRRFSENLHKIDSSS